MWRNLSGHGVTLVKRNLSNDEIARKLSIKPGIAQIKGMIPAAARAAVGRSIRNLRRRTPETLGIDFIAEIKSRLPKFEIKTIFDVGANIGMTALEFSDAFPSAIVYAFEPSSINFQRMESNLIGKPEIRKFRTGIGAAPSTAVLYLDPQHPTTVRLRAHDTGKPEEITIETLDDICAAQDVRQISILKIDTEGHELHVLHGAKNLLSDSAIGLIKAEVAIDPDSDYHTKLFDFADVLHGYGYRLFGFYDQFEDTIDPGPRLRRFDAAFMSSKLFLRPFRPHPHR